MSTLNDLSLVTQALQNMAPGVKIEPKVVEPWPVIYQWIGEDGQTHYGNSVADGTSAEDAARRFFRQHPHVKPVYDYSKVTIDYD